jgi:hypothetical protein
MKQCRRKRYKLNKTFHRDKDIISTFYLCHRNKEMAQYFWGVTNIGEGEGSKRTIEKCQRKKQEQKDNKTCICQHTEHAYLIHSPTPHIPVHSVLEDPSK